MAKTGLSKAAQAQKATATAKAAETTNIATPVTPVAPVTSVAPVAPVTSVAPAAPVEAVHSEEARTVMPPKIPGVVGTIGSTTTGLGATILDITDIGTNTPNTVQTQSTTDTQATEAPKEEVITVVDKVDTNNTPIEITNESQINDPSVSDTGITQKASETMDQALDLAAQVGENSSEALAPPTAEEISQAAEYVKGITPKIVEKGSETLQKAVETAKETFTEHVKQENTKALDDEGIPIIDSDFTASRVMEENKQNAIDDTQSQEAYAMLNKTVENAKAQLLETFTEHAKQEDTKVLGDEGIPIIDSDFTTSRVMEENKQNAIDDTQSQEAYAMLNKTVENAKAQLLETFTEHAKQENTKALDDEGIPIIDSDFSAARVMKQNQTTDSAVKENKSNVEHGVEATNNVIAPKVPDIAPTSVASSGMGASKGTGGFFAGLGKLVGGLFGNKNASSSTETKVDTSSTVDKAATDPIKTGGGFFSNPDVPEDTLHSTTPHHTSDTDHS